MKKSILLVILCTMLVACETAYYNTMEKFGIEKRDILVDRIEDTKEAQEDAQQQFKDALDQYRSVVNFDGGDIEKMYNKLNSEYEDSEALAQSIAEHIRSVESVSEDLFDEWQQELSLIKSANLRRDSAAKLKQTRRRSAQLIAAMWRAEKSVHPVLDSLRDQVYYLKHNLNANAVAALKSELAVIDTDVNRLLRQMQASINEANTFINQL